MVTIDVHSHYIPSSYWDAINARIDHDPTFAGLARRNNLVVESLADRMRRVDGRLADMDSAAIDLSVLSLPPPGSAVSASDTQLAMRINDELIEVAESHADRFRVLACLPLPNVDVALSEIDRARASEFVRGIAVTTKMHDWRLDDPQFDAVWCRLAELDLPLFTHPALEEVPPAFDDYDLVATVSAIMSSTVGVLRLVYGGTFDRVPDLKVIMPHLGGTLPYLQQRLDDLSRSSRAVHPIGHYLQSNLILDCCSYHPPALQCALETVGADRLALGTDYPFRGSVSRAVSDIQSHPLSKEDREAILGGNISRWFA
jgi:predicted TIM-barrel fold metal-dependent hydrolase